MAEHVVETLTFGDGDEAVTVEVIGEGDWPARLTEDERTTFNFEGTLIGYNWTAASRRALTNLDFDWLEDGVRRTVTRAETSGQMRVPVGERKTRDRVKLRATFGERPVPRDGGTVRGR